MKKVRVAIIGYGHLGRWHAEKANILESSELIAIVEVNKNRHQEIKEKFPSVIVTDSLAEILPQIDAGIVVTPTTFHFGVVKELLKNKKHVFCEKPLCSSMEEASEIESVQKESLVKIQVGHSERFHAAWENLRDYCLKANNAMIEIKRTSPFKGRATDVDVVQDLMIHDIDLLRYLFAAEIKNINSFGVKNLSSHWDHVNVLFDLNKGNKAFITSSRNSCTEERSLRVSDSRGELFIDLITLKAQTRNNKGELLEEKTFERRDHLLAEQSSFFDSILNNKPEVVNLRDGILAVDIMDTVLGKLESQKSL